MLIAGNIGGTKTDLAIYSIESASDPNNPTELCRATIKISVSILANEVGNLAPKVLATGGVYNPSSLVTPCSG